jgi:hypothetical protein
VLRVPGNAGMRETEKATRGSISARLVKILTPANWATKPAPHSKFVHRIYRTCSWLRFP